ncbi:RNA-binding cell elongation regulator Jag/EloR [Saccharococcus caldoxylosilyticus]|uniref:RNA-binding protein KhpB n=1 Tax=Parageobacillus caldoxylosilyticus NBRC 107762 TaxID=1220594 RepID=A0A023DB61_9BACL|nr:RNA-binding cell elongation regulator Jag/EloR [Parageobacillus caldoxylosilyticus]MBB3851277.1 spoIIIJ-associated protein [Parageobacillus caldoxylosilyticus]GAJ38558.1 Jag protein [Parageobacillus caldoxylosilyticus NBRC 107762]
MKEVTVTAATVDEAVQSALQQLGVSKNRVEIVVLDEGKKGLFGIFGHKPAVVKAILKKDPIEEAELFLKEVIQQMGVNAATIEKQQHGKQVTFMITGEQVGLLIGKHGQTLSSLQLLTQLVANRYAEEYVSIVVDAENYRERREKTLIQLAQKLAEKAVKTGKEVKLEPLPAHERKIIHSALANHKKVVTYSVGVEPHRYIVVSPSAQ